MKKSFLICSAILFSSIFSAGLFAKEPCVEAESFIDWTTKTFKSDISLDTKKGGFQMPSGKKSASVEIKTKMPELIQRSLLTLYVNSSQSLGDKVMDNSVTLDSIAEVIETGKKSTDIFTSDLKKLNTTNLINVNDISKVLVKHKFEFTPEEPIETVPSRAYSGIIIDARGSLPIHGEYISSEVFPCFFPTIWDEEMTEIYEKNIVQESIATKEGIVAFDWSDDYEKYEDRIGFDPLYIRAVKVYGRNRTDPIIRKKDALKILSVPDNIRLLHEGKVVILLDKKNLVYKISSPQKDNEYYVKYNTVKQYMYENKVDDIEVIDDLNGILFSVDLKFYPDSPELLPGEEARIAKIGEMLQRILIDNSYTILVEGHTADVGKPTGQLNLSIDRTRTVMNALIDEGINRELFTYKGYGGTRPVATNATEEGRAQNRRVDITARPKATYIQRDW